VETGGEALVEVEAGVEALAEVDAGGGCGLRPCEARTHGGDKNEGTGEEEDDLRLAGGS
jgi:hypothetical protein